MPRKPSVFWDRAARAWRSDCGPLNVFGRRKRRPAVYFREIPPSDRGKREAERQLAEYIRIRDTVGHPPAVEKPKSARTLAARGATTVESNGTVVQSDL